MAKIVGGEREGEREKKRERETERTFFSFITVMGSKIGLEWNIRVEKIFPFPPLLF